MKCKFCSSETDDIEYFGLLKRISVTQHGSGSSNTYTAVTFEPMALIRVGICPICRKQAVRRTVSNNVKSLLISMVLCIIGTILAVLTDAQIAYLLAVAAGIAVITSIVFIFINVSYKTACSKQLMKTYYSDWTIPWNDLLMPPSLSGLVMYKSNDARVTFGYYLMHSSSFVNSRWDDNDRSKKALCKQRFNDWLIGSPGYRGV